MYVHWTNNCTRHKKDNVCDASYAYGEGSLSSFLVACTTFADICTRNQFKIQSMVKTFCKVTWRIRMSVLIRPSPIICVNLVVFVIVVVLVIIGVPFRLSKLKRMTSTIQNSFRQFWHCHRSFERNCSSIDFWQILFFDGVQTCSCPSWSKRSLALLL